MRNYALWLTTIVGLLATRIYARDFCILGGGAAGITTAYFLKEKGYDVEIFEASDRLFGKVKQVQLEDDLVEYPMGAVFADVGESPIAELLERFEIPTSPLPAARFDVDTTPDSPRLTRVRTGLSVIVLVARYGLRTLRYRAALDVFDYTDPVLDPIKSKSALEFLQDNFLMGLYPIFFRLFSAFGYGMLRDVPAIYMIQAYSPRLLRALAFGGGDEESRVQIVPFQELLTRMVEDIPYRINVRILKITRIRRIYRMYTTRNRIVWLNCPNVVVAFPPVGSSEDFGYIPLNNENLTAFTKLVANDYYSSLVSVSHPERVVVLDTVPAEDEIPLEPTVYANYFDPESYTVEYLAPTGNATGNATEEEVREVMISAARKMYGEADVEIVDFNKWGSYFPHCALENVSDYFEAVASFQGVDNLYFVGGMVSMETIGKVMQHAKLLVDSIPVAE